MVSNRERRLWLLSVLSLPLLIAGAYTVFAWRNFEDYLQRTELRVSQNKPDAIFAKAVWRLDKIRLIGDGHDTKVVFPGQTRLLVLRIAAEAKDDIGDAWSQCQVTLTDDHGRLWRPLDFIVSNNISREIDPQTAPVDGCDAVSRQPPKKGADALIEEKFVIPADVANSLSARLSFLSSRPDALTFPLTLR